MSYCRFSHNDFQCDVYCYQSTSGPYVIAVAAYRLVFKEELPAKVPFSIDAADAWFERHRNVRELVQAAPKEPIGLPCDGKIFEEWTPGDAANRLQALLDMGYLVPSSAIESLREEQAELDIASAPVPAPAPSVQTDEPPRWGVSLHPGGTLLFVGEVEDPESKEWLSKTSDVSTDPVPFLFSSTKLVQGVTVRDVLKLIERNTELQESLSAYGVNEVLDTFKALPSVDTAVQETPDLKLQECLRYFYETDTYEGLGHYELRWGAFGEVTALPGELLPRIVNWPIHATKTLELDCIETSCSELKTYSKYEHDEPSLWVILTQLLSALSRQKQTRPSLTLAANAWLRLNEGSSSADVSKEAHRYLGCPLTLEGFISLADVLRTVETCPALLNVFKRYYAKEILQELDKGPVWLEPGEGDPLEYLEIKRVVQLDSATSHWENSQPAEFFGYGAELTEDLQCGDTVLGEKGTRIKYGVSSASLRSMLHLPVYVREEFDVQEADRHSTNWYNVTQSAKGGPLTLGEFLHGIFAGLSAYGPPTHTAEDIEKIEEALEATIVSEPTKTIDDVFVALGFDSLAELYRGFYENSDCFIAWQVQAVTDELPDHVPAVLSLASKAVTEDSDARLQLKPEFAHLTGRELRVALHDAHLESVNKRRPSV